MPERSEKKLAPTGTHRAVLYKLINLGTLNVEWDGEPKKSHKIRLGWELSDEEIEYEKDGETIKKPFVVDRKFTFSLGDNAHLTPIVEGMIGKPLFDKEKAEFDIETLLGMSCLITIVHDEYNGNKFAKVTNATLLPKGMEKPTQVNENLILDVRKMSREEIDELPEFIANDMKSSDEYRVRFEAPRSETPETDLPDVVKEKQELEPGDLPF